MAFVVTLYEKLTVGELAFLTVSFLMVGILGFLSSWPTAYVYCTNWLDPWRTDQRTIVVIAPDPLNPGKKVYHDLGPGVPYDLDGMTLPPKGYITTRDRMKQSPAGRIRTAQPTDYTDVK